MTPIGSWCRWTTCHSTSTATSRRCERGVLTCFSGWEAHLENRSRGPKVLGNGAVRLLQYVTMFVLMFHVLYVLLQSPCAACQSAECDRPSAPRPTEWTLWRRLRIHTLNCPVSLNQFLHAKKPSKQNTWRSPDHDPEVPPLPNSVCQHLQPSPSELEIFCSHPGAALKRNSCSQDATFVSAQQRNMRVNLPGGETGAGHHSHRKEPHLQAQAAWEANSKPNEF